MRDGALGFLIHKNKKWFLLLSIISILLLAILSFTILIYRSATLARYPNANLVGIQDFSVSNNSSTHPVKTIFNGSKPCLSLSYQVVLHTSDKPDDVTRWYSENGWGQALGHTLPFGMTLQLTDSPYLNFVDWMSILIEEQKSGIVQIEIDQKRLVCLTQIYPLR